MVSAFVVPVPWALALLATSLFAIVYPIALGLLAIWIIFALRDRPAAPGQPASQPTALAPTQL